MDMVSCKKSSYDLVTIPIQKDFLSKVIRLDNKNKMQINFLIVSDFSKEVKKKNYMVSKIISSHFFLNVKLK